jgi:hypothetical protein
MQKGGDLSQAIKLIRSQIMNLQTFNWGKLVAMIEQIGAHTTD